MSFDVSGGLRVPRIALRILNGAGAGKTFQAEGDRAVIGSHEAADLVLEDGAVSRLHCEVAIAGERIVLRDLESKNGTFVDGVAVGVAYLKAGAMIAIGRTTLRFEVGKDEVRVPLSARERFGLMVGVSAPMRRVFAALEKAADSDVTVLLEGETGTGKEVAAESLHRESARKDGPLIVVDCGAVPANLLESELFGHERGAFTGAVAARAGAFMDADGGTIFLDEIGELPLELQPKLLRVLESRTIKKVGASKHQPVDIRVVAATNRDLQAEVNAGRFRSDLYYRLAVVRVRLPALRERPEDLPAIVEHLLRGMRIRDERAVAFVRSPAFLAELARHTWPGNVRELRNHLERSVALQHPETLQPPTANGPELEVDIGVTLREAREQWAERLEKVYLTKLLEHHGQNVSAAARAADVDRIHFYRLLRRWGLK